MRDIERARGHDGRNPTIALGVERSVSGFLPCEPRKVNSEICTLFPGRRDNEAPQDWTQDVAWLAARDPDSTVGYRLLIGGMQGQSTQLGWNLPVFVRPGQVVEVTLPIMQLFRKRGSRSARRNQARFRYLIDALGLVRFYEITQVFGTTLKALIEEEFGDGIMSAIDFELSVGRVSDPKGDRVKVTFNGKFLPYRKY